LYQSQDYRQDEKCSDQIVKHHAGTTMNFSIYPPNQPWFPDIEKPEHQKSN